MSWTDIKKAKGESVLGLDVSTKSIAFAIFKNGKPVRCGEIFINGATEYDQAQDAATKVRALVGSGILEADYIAIEGAVYVNNMKVAIKLATVFGAVVGNLGGKTVGLTPLEWQSGIGNPSFKKADKDQFKKDNPGKTESWYKSQIREIRKQRTLKFARQFFAIESGSDNVGDAVGISFYCSQERVKP